MAQQPSKSQLVDALLERHGQTYCEELGIDIEKDTPSPLFRWLVASILFSTRISAAQATKAAAALAEHGWTTADKMAAATWAQRTRVLNRAGYARYDESTSRKLGEVADLLLREYDGDLRNLRERAQRDPRAERRLLKAFKGLGDVGVSIFCREIQVAWPEQYPFADRKALAAAKRLRLAGSVPALSQLVSRHELPRLLAALVRTSLEKDFDAVRRQASERGRKAA